MNIYTVEDVMALIPLLQDREEGYAKSNYSFQVVSEMIVKRGYRLSGRDFTPMENNFIRLVPFREVPKFINDEDLRMFSTWRLKIGT